MTAHRCRSVSLFHIPVPLLALRLPIQRLESPLAGIKTLVQQVYHPQSARLHETISRSCPAALTSGYNNPNEVQKDVVTPKVKCLWSPVHIPGIVMIKQAGSVVKNIAIDLAQRDHGLEGVAEGMFSGDHEGDDKTEGAPADLWGAVRDSAWA